MSLHRRVILGYVAVVWALSVVFLAGPQMFTLMGVRAVTLMSNVIGVSASIPPNEWNSLAAQLAAKEAELNTRESALSAREQAIASEVDQMGAAREQRVYGYLFVLTAVLLILVLSNFYLDYRRGHAVG